jgi:site-specific recombinase XerD
MMLAEFFDNHFVPSRPPETSPETFRQYRGGLSLFARFLNCTPRLADLSDAKIAGFMTWLLDRGRSPATANKHRTMLVALAYVARRLDLINWWPEVPKLDTGPQRPTPSDKPHDVAKRKRQIAKPYPSSADRIAQAPEGSVGHYYRTRFVLTELGQCGPRTRHQYATAVGKFIEFSGGHTSMADLTMERIEAFYRYVKATCGSNLTASKYRRQLRRILYAHKPETPRPLYPPNKIVETNAPEGSLRWLFDSRYTMERQLRANTTETYKDGLRWFDRFLGRAALLTDLNKVTINQYLFWSERQHVTMRTVKSRYRVVRALWNYAWHEEMVEAQPGRGIRKLRLPPVIPTSWTMAEIVRLLEATHAPAFDCWTGRAGHRLHVGRFLNALVRLSYDSGLRRSDLFTVTWAQLEPDGRIVLVAQKTAKPHVARVRGDTIAALAVIRVDDDERLLPWPWCWASFYVRYRKLLVAAGLPVHRRHGLQMLRRTSATWLEAASPGSASWHLGHSTPTLARAHYLDPRYAAPSHLPPAIPEPPRLLEGPEREAS